MKRADSSAARLKASFRPLLTLILLTWSFEVSGVTVKTVVPEQELLSSLFSLLLFWGGQDVIDELHRSQLGLFCRNLLMYKKETCSASVGDLPTSKLLPGKNETGGKKTFCPSVILTGFQKSSRLLSSTVIAQCFAHV